MPPTLRGQARANVDLGLQRPVDRALAGDLEELRSLLLRQRSRKLDVAVDSVAYPLSRLTVGTVCRVDLPMSEPDGHVLERPSLAARVERDGHRGARAEAGQ